MRQFILISFTEPFPGIYNSLAQEEIFFNCTNFKTDNKWDPVKLKSFSTEKISPILVKKKQPTNRRKPYQLYI